MKIKVNGKEKETSAATIAELVKEMELPQTGVAVAVNNKMVPRDKWTETELAEGMSLVVIKAACGG